MDRIEKVDKDSLAALKNHAVGLGDTLSSIDRHTLLLHGLSLADNYLSRVADKISFYKKNYASDLILMTDRHGQPILLKPTMKFTKK